MAKNAKLLNAARDLYLQGNHTNKEIAQILGVSAQTLSTYIKEGGWDEQRKTGKVTQELLLIKLYQQLDKILAESDDNPVNADTVVKYSRAIERIRGEAADIRIYRKVFQDFTSWLTAVDLELAQSIVARQDEFIRERFVE